MGDCELPGVNAGNQARVLRKSSKGLWLPSHHLSISTPVFWGTAHFIHSCAWIPWRRDSGTYAWLGERLWQMVVCWGKLSQAAGVSSSLYSRQCSEDATPHFGVLAHWLFWTEDRWGTPDTEIVSPKCPFSTWRDLPPKCSQLLWILCPNLHTYQRRWTWVAGIKLGVNTMTITYSFITQIFFYSK